MLTRRSLLTGSAAVWLSALPGFGFAQHVDLAPEGPNIDAPIQRRWMMEDTKGNVVTDSDLNGKFVLIYFGYTGCPDVCPTTLATIAEAMDALGDNAADVVPLFVTIDPEHDTAAVLEDFVSYMHPSIVALRGPLAYTDHMVKVFNARYEKHVEDPEHPERYTYDHTASVALVSPDGYLIKRYPHGTTGADMAADLGAIIDGLRK